MKFNVRATYDLAGIIQRVCGDAALVYDKRNLRLKKWHELVTHLTQESVIYTVLDEIEERYGLKQTDQLRLMQPEEIVQKIIESQL
jgi:hypothetical protein